ncbi:Bifunctional adenosylcobalamin biosynthesis protein CobU [Baekduia alba]|uniref:bifunctional adenosylcobinamide kinase/adenosylcobinamide-phosphate guanylyltransferase n=1 Tax=Baekduia alba TaxID=2997333 RepID=UPI002341975B|nr:bifunctional adenosylcobinamide kinase/adenosylcobinamide-phosphate guanylyltransferase [Baekduia alba]WCB93028.1 Bifunctional adenosylcobalamin biosynthesis protein CobU [Baekduia alba]
MALTLVLGPRRSGKSPIAEALAREPGAPVVVLAPLTVTDAEMAARVAAHQAARPAAWATVERIDVVGALRAAPPGATILMDSLGTWMSEVLWRAGALEDGADGAAAAAELRAAARAFAAVARERPGATIVVAEEAGWGPVPPSAATRLWLDVLGDTAQTLGEAADRALLVVAGRVVELP